METNHRISDEFSDLLRFITAIGFALTLHSCGPAYVSVQPTPPVVVRPIAPYAGAVWIDGGWRYRGGRHHYYNGYWASPRPGRAYYPGEWRQRPRGYYWVDGRWR